MTKPAQPRVCLTLDHRKVGLEEEQQDASYTEHLKLLTVTGSGLRGSYVTPALLQILGCPPFPPSCHAFVVIIGL